MLKGLLAIFSLFLFSSLSFAQSSRQGLQGTTNSTSDWWRGWEGEAELSIGPRIGEPLPIDSDDDIVDDSEGELTISITRSNIPTVNQLQFKLGITSSPQYLDAQDPESSYYGEVAIGDTYVSLRRLRPHSGNGATNEVEDAWRPYGRYRFTRIFQGFLNDYVRNEHQVTAGIRYRDVRSIMCDLAIAAATEVGACSNMRGVSWEVRAEVNRIWSSDDAEERFNPVLRFDLISRRLLGGVRIFGRAQAEAGFYQHARVPLTNERREDWRLRLTGGIDLSVLASRLGPDVALELAGQFQRRWSNDPSKEHSRAYFIPTLSVTTPF